MARAQIIVVISIILWAVIIALAIAAYRVLA